MDCFGGEGKPGAVLGELSLYFVAVNSFNSEESCKRRTQPVHVGSGEGGEAFSQKAST